MTESPLQRFKSAVNYIDLGFNELWEPLPEDIEGISYELIPVVVMGDTDECQFQFVKSNKMKSEQLTDEEIRSVILRDVMDIGLRQHHDLGISAVHYVDPREIDMIINKPTEREGRLLSIMRALDYLKLTVDGEDYYFKQNNTMSMNGNPHRFSTKGHVITVETTINKPSKFFNWVMLLQIEKQSKPKALSLI